MLSRVAICSNVGYHRVTPLARLTGGGVSAPTRSVDPTDARNSLGEHTEDLEKPKGGDEMSVPESKEATVTIELEMETAKAILRYFSTNDAALTNEQMFNA
jgi:hypothetical protein